MSDLTFNIEGNTRSYSVVDNTGPSGQIRTYEEVTLGDANAITGDLTVDSVGKVGNASGDLAIWSTAAGHHGLRMSNGYILPVDNNAAASDNAVSVGSSVIRFKDLYLSGGAYLGGTTSANLLNDYKEGNWTPVASGTWTVAPTFANAKYTKVGREVTLSVDITNTPSKASATSGWITGIPFTAVGKGIGSVTDTAIVNRGSFVAYDTRIFLSNTTFAATNFASVTYTV